MGNTKKIFILAIAIGIIVVVALLAVFIFSRQVLSEQDSLFYEMLGTNDVNDSLRFLKNHYVNGPDYNVLGTERLTLFGTSASVVNHSNKDICFNEKTNAQIYQFDEKNNTWIEIKNLSIGTTHLCVSVSEVDSESKTTYLVPYGSEECLESALTLIPWDDTVEGDDFSVSFAVSPSDIIDPLSPLRISVSGIFCKSGESVAAYIDIEYTP